MILILSLLQGCASSGSSDDPTAGMNAEQIYKKANAELKSGDYESAINFYERLEARFPYGQFADRAQMEIVYAYYKDNQQESAILAADRFIKLHPNHPNVDYLYYMRGLASYSLSKSFLDSLFNVDPTERDPKSARRAFEYFVELIKKFPKSRYAPDAAKRMVAIRNNLAKYEVHVANYDLSRGAYLAAANRSKYVVENYQRTPAVADALAIMVQAYNKLGMKELANDAERVLKLNYPNHKTPKL
ncbi:MAG: outer membrane protein assembly factor BamD [Gammaproteobacteria bacterium]